MFVINSIAPIFMLIALGKILERSGFLPESFFKHLNRLVFWFALPALLISKTNTATLELDTIYRIVSLFLIGTFASLLIGWVVSLSLKLPEASKGAFIQGAFRGNGAFVGLPLIVYTLAERYPHAETLGTVVLAPVVVIFNMLSVVVLLHYGKDRKTPGNSLCAFALQMVKNPLLMSCVIGIALNLLDIRLPVFLNRSMEALGRTSLPLVLMSIGAGLEFERLRGAASPSLVASLIKVVAAPAIGFLFAPLMGMGKAETMIAIFYLACPTAGMSYIMAQVMGNDATLAGRIVALSTLLSAITLPVIIALGL